MEDSSNKDVLTSVYNSLCIMIAKNSSRLLHMATEFCERAIDLSAESATVHNTLGVVLMERGRNKNAIKAFKRAAALNQTNTMVNYNMALAYSNIGEAQLAMESLERVLAADSDHTPARVYLQELQKSHSGSPS
jgi:Tfp pilus assembly protein PilF